jgi:uncharacterized protein
MSIRITNRKFYRYIYLRLVRQNGSAHTLALSVGIGIFFGFLIPICQMFLAIFVAWLFRVNKIVSAACTWVTNPVTIPIVFPFNVYLGSFFISADVDPEKISEVMQNVSISTLLDLGVQLGFDGFLMFLIGGAILGSVLSPFFYGTVYVLVVKHQNRKRERLLRRKKLKETGIKG